MKNIKEQLIGAHKVLLTSIVQMIRSFFLGPKGSIETNISKNSCFHGDKNFDPFFGIIKRKKPQGTLFKGPQGTLIITLEVTR